MANNSSNSNFESINIISDPSTNHRIPKPKIRKKKDIIFFINIINISSKSILSRNNDRTHKPHKLNTISTPDHSEKLEVRFENCEKKKHKSCNGKNYLSEKSIPVQKQPIQNKIVHFLETTFFEADSNPPPPLLFQLILLLFYLLKTANQELNQNKPISNIKSTS